MGRMWGAAAPTRLLLLLLVLCAGMPGLCQGERWEQVTMRSAALPQLLSWVLEWSSRGSPAAVLFQLPRGILLLSLGGTPQVICPGHPSMVLSSCPRAIPQVWL
eukprot:XP_027323448.1 uncharacterized protein LOC113845053 isoform X3 [Anas platyrhynchos]